MFNTKFFYKFNIYFFNFAKFHPIFAELHLYGCYHNLFGWRGRSGLCDIFDDVICGPLGIRHPVAHRGGTGRECTSFLNAAKSVLWGEDGGGCDIQHSSCFEPRLRWCCSSPSLPGTEAARHFSKLIPLFQ